MKALPHVYAVRAVSGVEGEVELSATGLPPLASAAPAEFGGPGNRWSPESLLCAAVADCFVLSFRAYARASKLAWHRLECHTEGTLDRVDGVTQFTRFVTRAKLTVTAGASTDLCQRVLEKAEGGCLIANSLRGQRHLETEILTTNAT